MNNRNNFTSALTVFLATALLAIVCGLMLGAFGPELLGVAVDFAGLQHDGYLQIAHMLVHGEGFRFEPGGRPVMHRPPLYPLLLMPIATLPMAAEKVAVIALNGVLVGISCTLLYKLALRLYNDERVAWGAICLYIVSPWLWRLITLPHTAILQSTLYLGAAFFMFKMVFGTQDSQPDSPQQYRRFALAFGVLSGLMSLTHGAGFLVFAACIIALGVLAFFPHPHRISRSSRFGSVALAALAGALLIAPWTARNLSTFPITIPVTTGASFNYFMGNVYWGFDDESFDVAKSNRDNALIAGGLNKSSAEAMQFWGVMDPADEKILADNMKAHIKSHPEMVLKKSVLSLEDNFFPVVHMLVCRHHHMHSCEHETWMTSAHKYGISIYYGVIIFLALLSVYRHRTPGKIALFLFALGALHIGPYLPLGQWAPHGIYGLSSILLIIALAANGLLGRQTPKALASAQ